MNQLFTESEEELSALCNRVRALARKGDHAECDRLIANAMSKYPHAPQPHNLMGILFEMKKNHISAMKHFRAAWALDPTYLPARHNLDTYASFQPSGQYAFDEKDLRIERRELP